jgi:hypothetical protein
MAAEYYDADRASTLAGRSHGMDGADGDTQTSACFQPLRALPTSGGTDEVERLAASILANATRCSVHPRRARMRPAKTL